MKQQLLIQHKLFIEFHVNHKKDAPQNTIDILSVIENHINGAISEGVNRVELRYLNIPNHVTNPEGNVGTIRVIGYRNIKPSELCQTH